MKNDVKNRKKTFLWRALLAHTGQRRHGFMGQFKVTLSSVRSGQITQKSHFCTQIFIAKLDPLVARHTLHRCCQYTDRLFQHIQIDQWLALKIWLQKSAKKFFRQKNDQNSPDRSWPVDYFWPWCTFVRILPILRIVSILAQWTRRLVKSIAEAWKSPRRRELCAAVKPGRFQCTPNQTLTTEQGSVIQNLAGAHSNRFRRSPISHNLGKFY